MGACSESVFDNKNMSTYYESRPYHYKWNLNLYQNIQGLIPFGHLGSKHPIFNDTILIELHHYVETYSPDVVTLNETWLK